MPEWGQAGGVLLGHRMALGAEFFDSSVQVAGVPKGDRVEHDAQRYL